MHPTPNSEPEPTIANIHSKDPNGQGLRKRAVKLSSLTGNKQHTTGQRTSHTTTASKKSLMSE